MKRLRSMALAICILGAVATGQTVVNIDIGNGAGTYSGQGAFADQGNDFWNGIGTSGSNLLASDGATATGISVALNSGGGFSYANTNSLLADYQFVTTFFGRSAGTIAITGLQPNADHLIYVYSAGDAVDQSGVISLNGVTGLTSGSTASQFVEGANYVVLEVESDANGDIRGVWEPYSTFAAINGFQIVAGSLPPRVLGLAGAESPTVHSPGDPIIVTVSFSDTVTLSQVGGAELELDINGTLVKAVHTGATVGGSLTFEAIAPASTTTNAKVLADSLTLLGGASLVDGDLVNVVLDHPETSLPNDQISVQGLSVYPPVPGLAPSPHYRFRVREIGGPWQSPFAWFTKCIDDMPVVPYGYYNDWIGGWSHTYCNFEMANNVPVEVEITRLDPLTGLRVDIQKAVPHPRRKVRSWRVERGRAYVRLDRPTLFAVDIDGQMDENPTPSAALINENAVHAVSVFANPFILDKPDLNDPDVLAVDPGVIPPDNGTWKTLYFKPGVHQLFVGSTWDLGEDFRLRSGKSYYIPGDAMVHGNMNNRDVSSDAQGIRVFGHGTLSGERIDHAIEQGISSADEWRTRAVRVASDAKGCRVEGITIADPANHSCALVGRFNVDPADHNYVRWCKAITWRANGDGISPNGTGFVEDCFLRTQDDGTYVTGLAVRRVVYWSDVNGMALRCSFLTYENPVPYRQGLIVDDIDVIYARAGFGSGPDLSIIGYPDPFVGFPGNSASHVVFRNVNVEDPFPVRTLFGWDLTTLSSEAPLPGATSAIGRERPARGGEVVGVRFENVRMAAPAVGGDRDVFLGRRRARIRGLIFDDVTLAGRHYQSLQDFDRNGDVFGFVFENTAPETMTYLDSSGYGKWYVAGDWDSGVEPADNDVVNHTAVPEVLVVDAPAYAGSLNISHPQTATVAIEAGGHLTVTNGVTIGLSGDGILALADGVLEIRDSQSSALSVASGSIHLENGTISWAGNHVSDIQSLFAAGLVTFAKGQVLMLANGATLIGQIGTSELYADFGNLTPGHTTVWVVDLRLLRAANLVQTAVGWF